MSVNAGDTGKAAVYNRDTRQAVARARRVTDSSTSASGTLVPVMRLDDIALVQGRLYKIWTAPLGMDGTVADDVIRATITHTTDGSTPTISSTILPGGLAQESQANATQGVYPSIQTTYTPAGASEQLSLLLCVSRSAGSGTVRLLGDATNIIEIVVEDVGVDPGDTGTEL